MRTSLAATLMIVAAAGTAQAQMTNAPVAGVKPKPVATTPIRPALQTPTDTANAMAQAERQAIQSDLAWTGHFNGAISGEVSERMLGAIKAFQKDNGGKPTGVLNPQERGVLAASARKAQDNVGWKLIGDPVTGARLGLPLKLVPTQSADANGAKWSSSTGTIQIQLARRKEATPSTAKLAEQEKKEPVGRKVEYSVVKPDFFVLSGMQGLKKFYVRGQFKDAEVRILTVLYDQATEGTMDPVVIAMSSAFNPFPIGAQIAAAAQRKKVEYATGIVVDGNGAIVTDRQAVDGCLSVVVAGHGHADIDEEDKDHDLALLKVYGAQGLKPMALDGGAAKSSVELIGIADPQSQGGGAAASSVRSTATPIGSAHDFALAPAPGLGFAGAAAVDADGKFAGLAQMKPVLFAGPANGAVPAQAGLLPAEAVRGFLKANEIVPIRGAVRDAKASMVRVICVRK
jgi:peptidoglycan hydrolase-like protein with peptidoglycan-binding domain